MQSFKEQKGEIRKPSSVINAKKSVQFSHSVVSDSLRPQGLQHTRLPCPSPVPRACSNSCPSNQWCHPTISSSVIPSSSCLQSFSKSGSFLMSQFFSSGSQSCFNISPSNESFRTDLFDLLDVQETPKMHPLLTPAHTTGWWLEQLVTGKGRLLPQRWVELFVLCLVNQDAKCVCACVRCFV